MHRAALTWSLVFGAIACGDEVADPVFGMDPEADDDFDGVANAEDRCHGGRDSDDFDGDGVPNACSTAPFVHIGTSVSYACGLRTDGVVSCWGARWDASIPQTNPAPFTELYMPKNRSTAYPCGVDREDTSYCWSDGAWNIVTPLAESDPTVAVAPAVTGWYELTRTGALYLYATDADADVVQVEGEFTKLVSDGYRGSCALSTEGELICDGWSWDDVETGGARYQDFDIGVAGLCALDAVGRVDCWPEYDSSAVTSFAVAPGGTALAVGVYAICGLDADGAAWCEPSEVADERTVEAPAGSFEQLVAGNGYVCGRGEAGDVVCTSAVDAPAKFAPMQQPRTHVALGDGFACAAGPERGVHCASFNGANAPSLPIVEDVAVLTAGVEHACVLDNDGHLGCAGEDYYGETAVPAGVFDAVVAGAYTTCARAEGAAWTCWGDRSSPLFPMPENLAFDRLAIANTHACGLDGDGVASCWGDNSGGALELPDDTRWRALAVKSYGTCGVSDAGELRCVGSGVIGVQGGVGPFVDVAAAEACVCGVTEAGGLRCWGSCGIGRAWRTPPGSISEAVGRGTRLCGLTRGGELRCWGDQQTVLVP